MKRSWTSVARHTTLLLAPIIARCTLSPVFRPTTCAMRLGRYTLWLWARVAREMAVLRTRGRVWSRFRIGSLLATILVSTATINNNSSKQTANSSPPAGYSIVRVCYCDVLTTVRKSMCGAGIL
jgi:hypothetical protein